MGRRRYYTKAVDSALFDVWEAANRPCGVLLHPLVKEYVDILVRDGMWKHEPLETELATHMSERTMRRRLEVFKKKYDFDKGKSTTKPSYLKSIIPIFKGPWDNLPPGNGQIDTVAHCGSSLAGDYGFTVSYIDSATYWIVSRMQWNKGQFATCDSLKIIKNKLPVPMLHLHPDTGSEFINYHLKDWCDQNQIKLTRSEPNKKNDNMYIEERNGHVIRKYLGYTRFDCPEVLSSINELYDLLALYLNHFQAVRRTLTKERVGAKYKRTYQKPATPYSMMMNNTAVPKTVKDGLKQEHETLNPLVLKRKIDKLTSEIMKKQRVYGN